MNKINYLLKFLKFGHFLSLALVLGLSIGLVACDSEQDTTKNSLDMTLEDAGEPEPDMIMPACAGETAAGEATAGEATAGEATAGEATAGEATAGEATAGEATAGEATAGEATAGEATAGEATAGEATAGEATAGEATAGEATAGEATAGEATAGEATAGEATAGSEMNMNSEASSRYDGVYFATFESEGFKTALARVEVRLGLIEGEVLNRYGEFIELGGFIDEQGMLRIPPLIGTMGSTFNATGRVSRLGIIEGTFTVTGAVSREGSFAGSLENQPIYQPSPEYDGLYDLSFIRAEQEVAVTSMAIDQGRFSLVVVSASGARFEANGFVSEDGTLALLGTAPSDVLAEGFIDPDTKNIKGIYAVGRGIQALVGDIHGREAD